MLMLIGKICQLPVIIILSSVNGFYWSYGVAKRRAFFAYLLLLFQLV